MSGEFLREFQFIKHWTFILCILAFETLYLMGNASGLRLCFIPVEQIPFAVCRLLHNRLALLIVVLGRCDKTIFMTTDGSPGLNTVVLDVVDSYDSLWLKTRAAIIYLEKHYASEFDWYVNRHMK